MCGSAVEWMLGPSAGGYRTGSAAGGNGGRSPARAAGTGLSASEPVTGAERGDGPVLGGRSARPSGQAGAADDRTAEKRDRREGRADGAEPEHGAVCSAHAGNTVI